jgi:transposase-like protein
MATKKKRRTYTAEFKSKVALEALQGVVSAKELGKRYDLHPNLVTQWKNSLEKNCHRIFEDSHPEKDKRDKLIETQNREIKQLTADVDFLKKNLSPYL